LLSFVLLWLSRAPDATLNLAQMTNLINKDRSSNEPLPISIPHKFALSTLEKIARFKRFPGEPSFAKELAIGLKRKIKLRTCATRLKLGGIAAYCYSESNPKCQPCWAAKKFGRRHGDSPNG
jgi:hypothetical protein